MKCTTICPICVDFRGGRKPEYPEKNPHMKPTHITWFIALAFSVVKIELLAPILYDKLEYL